MIIGVFVLAALAIVVFIMLFLHPNVGNEGKIVRVRFADIDKITPGTRVNFGGKPVGEVIDILEIKTENGKRIEKNGVIYIYELILAVDSEVVLYTTDEISSRTSGLLGEKSVAIIPTAVTPGTPLIPVKGQVLYASETGSVESTLKNFKELAEKIELTLDGFVDAFDKLKREKVWENIGSSVENISEIALAMNQPAKIHSIVNDAGETMRNLKETTTAFNRPDTISEGIDNISKSIDNVTLISNVAKEIIVNVQQGEGSIGALLVKDDLYLRTASLMNKGEVLLNDINHYGILFHQDKGWQRLRARRLNLLHSLSDPQEFRNYFNDELDRVTTALERVSMVIEKSSEFGCRELWKNPEYVKVYAELLRRVAMVEEYLQMYNEQVVECAVQQTEFAIPHYCR